MNLTIFFTSVGRTTRVISEQGKKSLFDDISDKSAEERDPPLPALLSSGEMHIRISITIRVSCNLCCLLPFYSIRGE